MHPHVALLLARDLTTGIPAQQEVDHDRQDHEEQRRQHRNPPRLAIGDCLAAHDDVAVVPFRVPVDGGPPGQRQVHLPVLGQSCPLLCHARRHGRAQQAGGRADRRGDLHPHRVRAGVVDDVEVGDLQPVRLCDVADPGLGVLVRGVLREDDAHPVARARLVAQDHLAGPVVVVRGRGGAGGAGHQCHRQRHEERE
ncbi:hypothetical protein [Serinicoccus marinus]|uniref:hypothetical protein n=1 Tax=Serinicoccus marinus TaxID=247333 RepID=UPI0003B4CE94|nr:hypothetical protein [Serinicoccus marinus]